MKPTDHLGALRIGSPKRTGARRGWEGFFPYYAGYPLSFAERVLASAQLSSEAIVLDPWNGSGTTTSAAASLGLSAIGFDINPVMITVAKARLLSRVDADSLTPLALAIVEDATADERVPSMDEPLYGWFMPQTTSIIRRLEAAVRRRLVGSRTISADGTHLDQLSSIAAAFYCALFVLSRELVKRHQSSNPTWLRTRVSRAERVRSTKGTIERRFMELVSELGDELVASPNMFGNEQGAVIALRDSKALGVASSSVDFILSSPPYCTRIDYTAATRVELAVLWELLPTSVGELSRQMMGSIRVPESLPLSSPDWGKTCIDFLQKVKSHKSKASGGYYLNTHLDYFSKLFASLREASRVLKSSGVMVLVVQDSYYKEVHNDLPRITTEMAASFGMKLARQEDFVVKRTMSGINPQARAYRSVSTAVESVLCFNSEG